MNHSPQAQTTPGSFAAPRQLWQRLHTSAQTQRIAIALILLLALLLRLIAVIHWNSYQPDSLARLNGDEPGYDNIARELLQGYGFTWPGRVPLYPIWLAAVYLIQDSYAAVSYAQIIPGLAAVYLTILLGRQLFGIAVGLLAGLGSALSYTLIHQSLHLLSEILYTPMLLAVALSLVIALQRNSPQIALLGGVLLGLANLVRPTLLMFTFASLALFGVYAYVQQQNQAAENRRTRIIAALRRAGRLWAAYALAACLTMAPWVMYSAWRFGAIIPLQTSNAILWQGSPEYHDLIYEQGYSYMQIWSEVLYGPGWQERDPNSIAGDRYWTQRAIASISADPLTYLRYAAEKSVTYWVGDSPADWGGQPIFSYNALRELGFTPRDALLVMFSRALPLITLALVLVARPPWRTLLPIYGMMIYTTLLHAATHAEVRLSEPFQPLVLVVAAAALLSLAQRRGRTQALSTGSPA